MPATKKPTGFARLATAINAIGPTLGKSADNPFFKSKYLPLPELLTEVRPHLDANGLMLVFPNRTATIEGTVNVAAAIIDAETGDTLVESNMTMPCPNDPQKATAAVTYGRRTCATSVLGIAEKDDDGESTKGASTRASAGSKGDTPKGFSFA